MCLLGALEATVEAKGEGGEITLAFDFSGPCSTRPSPPWATCRCRPISPASAPDDDEDRNDYQTIYAREEGAVAAPTAGLHFTDELMAALAARGIAANS